MSNKMPYFGIEIAYDDEEMSVSGWRCNLKWLQSEYDRIIRKMKYIKRYTSRR